MQSRLTIALTGGIAAGKSIVSQYFAQLHVQIADADVIARDLVAPNQPALAEIAAEFGKDFLNQEGRLDRRRMRERIFADAQARLTLEAILHPRVREELQKAATTCSDAYCVLVVPLLAEHIDQYRWVDRILVVDARAETQLARLLLRDGMTRASAQRMLDAQASQDQRLALADDVIDNDGSLAGAGAAVRQLDSLYRSGRLTSRAKIR